MMSNHLKNTKGFTMIEMLVYIAVLVFAVVAMIVSFLSFDDSLIRNQTYRELTHSAQSVLERIGRDMRAAELADVTVANQLTLTTKGGATTTTYALSGNSVNLTVNGTNLGSLTDSDVSVEALNFTKYEGTGTELETVLVRVELTLSASSKAASSTRTYYTSAVLRGSYE